MIPNGPEIAEIVFERVVQMEERDSQKRKKRLKIAGASLAGVLFTAAIAGLVASSGGKIEAGTAAASVTMLNGAAAGAYVLAGVIGFSLGAAVIIIYMKRRAKRREAMNKAACRSRDVKK